MFRTRLHALWLLRSGRQMGEVASVVGVHYRTLQKWVSWYRTGGVEEVLSHMMKGLGQPRFLSEDQERELTEEVASGRFRTGGEIKVFLVRHISRNSRYFRISPKATSSPDVIFPSGLLTLLRFRATSSTLSTVSRKATVWDATGTSPTTHSPSTILSPAQRAGRIHRRTISFCAAHVTARRVIV